MSGLVGVWNLDGQPVAASLLARLSATLAHRGPDGEGHWIQGPVGLACQQFRVTPESAHETQPVADASGAAVIFDGRLDNRQDVLDRLDVSAGVSAQSGDAALVLAAYHQAGEHLPEWLLGDFAFVLFDPRKQQMLLARDAIGARPLYYARIHQAFCFASEIKAILAHPQAVPRPNEDQLGGLLVERIYDREQTCFRDIFSLPPAHLGILNARGFVKRQYWDFDPTARIRFRSSQEYTEAFRHLFEQAVLRRLRSRHPVAVSLSGGLDSSSIFCMALTLARHGRCSESSLLAVSHVTPGHAPSDEETFVQDIEQQYRTTVHRVVCGPSGVLNGIRQAVWHIEAPMLDGQWNNSQRLMHAIHERGARVVLTGHWGDQLLFSQAYLIDLLWRSRWRTIAKHLDEYPRWMGEANRPRYYERFRKDLVKYALFPRPVFLFLRGLWKAANRPVWYGDAIRNRPIRQQWQRAPFWDRRPTIHAQSLYEEIRIGYHILCLEWNNKVGAMHGVEMAFPFLDRDLAAFLIAIPGEAATPDGIPKGLLRRAMHDILPPSIEQRTWKADFTEVVNRGIASEFRQLIHEVEAGGAALARGYVRNAEVMSRLDIFQAGLARKANSCVASTLSDLLGLELWLQTFFGPHPAMPPTAEHAERSCAASPSG